MSSTKERESGGLAGQRDAGAVVHGTAQPEPGGEDAEAGLTAVGWVPRGRLKYDEWEVQGRWIGSVGRCSQWWVGDWVRFGASSYGEKYRRAAELTGYDEHSLRNMAYVASRFPDMGRRRESLSWSHHAELAPLPVEEQEAWLETSEGERLSVAALRARLSERRRLGRGGEESPAEEVDAEKDSERDAGLGEGPTGVVTCPNCGHEIVM